MRNPSPTPAVSAPLGEPAPRLSLPGSASGRMAQPSLPEPPTLGALPNGSRARVWSLSVAVYGGLLSGALALAVATPVKFAPVRTVTVSLETLEEAAPAPPPPSGPAGAGRTEALARSEEPAPVQVPVAPSPVEPLAPLASVAGGGQASGAPGGQVGGVPGGVMSGQPGGVAGGQVGGNTAATVVPPRFDAAYLQNPEPAYPLLSKRLGEEGRVVLRVLVNPDGVAEQVELRQSSGHARLDQAALGTVRRWRFTPARRGGDRLAAWVLVPLTFQLDA